MVALAGLAAAIGMLVARPVEAAEGDGAWTQPLFPPVDATRDPQESFQHDALGIVRVGDHEWRAYRGKYRDFVQQDDFLAMVGREDLASRLRASRATEVVLSYGGRAAALTGLVFLLADAAPGGFQPPPALSLGLLGGGILAWLVSNFFGDVPATAAEAVAFANRYNEGLRLHIDQQLRKPEKRGTIVRAPAAPPLLLPWATSPVAPGAPGGGLLVAFSF